MRRVLRKTSLKARGDRDRGASPTSLKAKTPAYKGATFTDEKAGEDGLPKNSTA
jgi:hypothetical protein